MDTPHPTPRPHAACSLLVSLHKVPGSLQACRLAGGTVASRPRAPSNSEFPASRTKFSFSIICVLVQPTPLGQVDVYVAGSWWTTTRSTRRYPRVSLVWATGFTFILPWSKFDPWHCLRLQVDLPVTVHKWHLQFLNLHLAGHLQCPSSSSSTVADLCNVSTYKYVSCWWYAASPIQSWAQDRRNFNSWHQQNTGCIQA